MNMLRALSSSARLSALFFGALLTFSACQKLDPTEIVTGSKELPTQEINLGKVSYASSLSEEEKAKVVATVEGQPVTQGELLDSAGSALFRLRTELANKEYMTLRKGLDELIEKRLLEKESQSRGLEVNALLDADVYSKVTAPTDEELQGFFNQNRRRFGPDATFEQHAAELREVFSGRKREQAKAEYVQGLKTKSKVTVTLPYPEMPTVTVSADDDPRMGSADAPVTIIEWSDFQCPYCKRNGETLKEVKQRYGDKVSVVFRDFPLPFHKEAPKASEAAECADEQGKFWEFHDKLFSNQQALDVGSLKKNAEELQLDMAKFTACLDSGKYKSEIDKDMAEGKVAGVTGTPATFINGKMLSGALPIDTYAAIIDAELAKAGR
ncbi:MAG: DsbA family protein [Myxococcota bacterium]